MKYVFFSLYLLLSTGLFAQENSNLVYHNADTFRIMGRGFTELDWKKVSSAPYRDSATYTRLPWSQKEEFRPELWDLGLHSAGITVRFRSNSTTIGVQWSVRSGFGMNHFAATGVRGVDLYVLEGSEWRYAATGIPASGKVNEKVLITEMNNTEKEFMLHLPLYDGVVKLAIGIDSTAKIDAPANPLPLSEKPIVCYGTSITQGGCASRPGMAYPAIISRILQREVINLGFSGNGRMDVLIGEMMTQIDAGAYIVDCLPNCTYEMIKDLGYDFLKNMVMASPNIPLFMVEHVITPAATFSKAEAERIQKKNQTWRSIHERLCNEGMNNIFYIPAQALLGEDSEATVDGIHLTDLGFLRMAKELSKVLASALE